MEMMTTANHEHAVRTDAHALRQLVEQYAVAVDRRDPDLLRAVLHPAGQVSVPGMVEVVGHEEIEVLLAGVRHFDRTIHSVTTMLHTVTGDTATGEVYCTAHHLLVDTDLTNLIRYEDHYVRDHGRWKIHSRVVHRLWETSTHGDAISGTDGASW